MPAVPRIDADLASRWQPLFKVLIDAAGHLAPYMAFLVLVLIGSPPLAYRMQRTGLIERHLTSTIIMGIYAASRASLSRMTLGKPITGARVVKEQGERPTLIRISVRTPCHAI